MPTRTQSTVRAPRAKLDHPVPDWTGVRDWQLMLSYLLFALLFFAPALSPAVNIFGTDYLAGAYFSHSFATDRLTSGALPKWNPYIYGGVPYFSNPGSTFYPPMLLLRWILPTHLLLTYILVLQAFVSGVGTYYLMRELGAHRVPAYLTGVSYMFTSFVVSNIYAGHDGRIIVATLAPAFFFAIHRAARTGALRWFVLGGAVLGTSLLSFQIQSNYYMLLGGGIFAAYGLFANREQFDGRGLALRLGGGALMLALGFGLAAVNFLPFLSYVERSPRAGAEGRGYEYSTSWSMPTEELVSVALPDYIGMLQSYWGENPIKFHTEYVGAWVLALLVVAAVVLRRDRRVWIWIGLAALAVLISLGGNTPIYRFFYEFLPGTKRFRAPNISFYLVSLSLNVIAGLALSRFAEVAAAANAGDSEATRSRNRVFYALAGGGGILVLIALWAGMSAPASAGDLPGALAAEPGRAGVYVANYPAFVAGAWRLVLFFAAAAALLWAWTSGRLKTPAVMIAFAAVILLDLWVVDKRFFDTVPPPSVYFAPDDVVQALRSAPENVFRTWYLPGTPQTNYPNLYGIELVAGEHGNQLQSYNEFLGAGATTYVDYHNIAQYPAFMALANVRYLVSSQPIDAPFLAPVHQGSALVYRNESALPRAYLATDYRVVARPDGALRAIQSMTGDPSSTVFLFDAPPASVPQTGPLTGGADVIRHQPDEVEISVQASRPAMLVLSDNDYPGWRASVNGAEVPILRANHTFRAVAVPAGSSTVKFSFRPQSIYVGFAITMTLMGVLLGYGAYLLWSSRRPRHADGS